MNVIASIRSGFSAVGGVWALRRKRKAPGWKWIAMVAVWSLAVHAECLLDARAIVIERGRDDIRKMVRLVRVFDGEYHSTADALRRRYPDVSWSIRTLGAQELEAALKDMGLFVGRDIHTVPLDAHFTLGAAEFEAPPGTLPGQWWASYVVEPAVSAATHREFVLRVSSGEDVAYTTAGNWTFSQTQDSKEYTVLRWVGERGRPDAVTADTSVPWILAGSRTTWNEIGMRLREIVAGDQDTLWCESGPDSVGTEPDPPQLSQHVVSPSAGTTSVSSPAGLLRVFDGFRREPPTPGFRTQPPAEFNATRAGTCKEFSRALLDILDERGQTAWLVFRATGLNDLDDIIPCPEVFDHIEVAVHSETAGFKVLDPFAGRVSGLPGMIPADGVWTHGNRLFVPWLRKESI